MGGTLDAGNTSNFSANKYIPLQRQLQESQVLLLSRSVISTSVITTPSTILSSLRYGIILTENSRLSSVAMFFSLTASVLNVS